MRTTVDLPEHIHELARNLAHDRRETFSQAVVELIERGLGGSDSARITTSPVTGLPVLTLGGPPITTEDVRALEDEEDEYLASFIRSGRTQ